MDARQFIEDVKEKYGEKVEDSKDESNYFDVIPTPSLALDISTGIGCIPTRRFTQIYGPKSVGKSTLALLCTKNVLVNGENALYLDIEGTTHYRYARLLLGDL